MTLVTLLSFLIWAGALVNTRALRRSRLRVVTAEEHAPVEDLPLMVDAQGGRTLCRTDDHGAVIVKVPASADTVVTISPFPGEGPDRQELAAGAGTSTSSVGTGQELGQELGHPLPPLGMTAMALVGDSTTIRWARNDSMDDVPTEETAGA